jgi:hypothetical protein
MGHSGLTRQTISVFLLLISNFSIAISTILSFPGFVPVVSKSKKEIGLFKLSFINYIV